MDAHWKSAKAKFFRDVKAGKALVTDNSVMVQYSKGNPDRFIYWIFGEMRLTDDYCCMQHSPVLTDNELGKLYKLFGR